MTFFRAYCVKDIAIGEKIISLPLHPNLTDVEIERVIDAVNKNIQNQVFVGGLKFIEAFKNFADEKLNEHQENKGIRATSSKRYNTTFRLRISKYLKGLNRIDEEFMDEEGEWDETAFREPRKLVGKHREHVCIIITNLGE